MGETETSERIGELTATIERLSRELGDASNRVGRQRNTITGKNADIARHLKKIEDLTQKMLENAAAGDNQTGEMGRTLQALRTAQADLKRQNRDLEAQNKQLTEAQDEFKRRNAALERTKRDLTNAQAEMRRRHAAVLRETTEKFRRSIAKCATDVKARTAMAIAVGQAREDLPGYEISKDLRSRKVRSASTSTERNIKSQAGGGVHHASKMHLRFRGFSDIGTEDIAEIVR